MAIQIKYYEVDTKDANYLKMEEISTTPVISIDGVNAIIKLHEGDNNEYPFFDSYEILTYDQCLSLRRSLKYQPKLQ